MSHSEDSLASTLDKIMQDAVSLRFDTVLPSQEAGPLEVLESLLDCRRRADRLETLYLHALTIKGRLARQAALDIAEAEDAWAQAIVQAKNSSAVKGDSFSGPRERYAEADLATLDLKRRARKSSGLLTDAEEAINFVRTTLNGLNNTRQDHINWIRSLQFMSNLEQ